jgi:hypothetical protein
MVEVLVRISEGFCVDLVDGRLDAGGSWPALAVLCRCGTQVAPNKKGVAIQQVC